MEKKKGHSQVIQCATISVKTKRNPKNPKVGKVCMYILRKGYLEGYMILVNGCFLKRATGKIGVGKGHFFIF